MRLPADVPLQVRLDRWFRYLAIAVMIMAGLVLTGWQFDIIQMRRVFIAKADMNPVTAVCVIFSAISLSLIMAPTQTKTKSLIGCCLATIVLLVGLVKTCSFFVDPGWQIDQFLFSNKIRDEAINTLPNAMQPNTAFGFIIAGIALWFVYVDPARERRKAQQAIHEAKKLSDKLIDSLPGVFYFFDTKGRFIRWNKQLETVTGYSAAEIAHMRPVDFFAEEEKKYISERIEGAFLHGENDADAHFLTKSGEKIAYHFRAVLINYESQPCLLGNGIDVTEQKLAEKQLRLSEQKYKLLFLNNPQPMIMLSLPEYQIIEVNTAAILQYGYTKEEFLKVSLYDLRPAEDIEKFKAATNVTFRGIQRAGIWRHKRKNGTIIYVDITTHDMNYEDRLVRLVLATDLTERYTAEEKLKESYDAIRKLTEHLQHIREEERTHIAREIHDELGQQLTVLKMDLAWLKKRIENPTEQIQEKMKALLSTIDSTVNSVRRISSELRPSLLDDLGLVPAMEWHLEEFEKRSGIKQQFTTPQKELHLSNDIKIGLFRIFQESLTNVARHAQAKKVNISLEKNDKKVILTIRDDGIGFDEGCASKNTLGILGMKERTLRLGGEYTINGTPGKGTTVSVAVPLNGSDHQNHKEIL